MFGKLGRPVGARRWLGRILIPVVAALAVALGTGSAAFAAQGSSYVYSGCQSIWTYNPYGASALAYEYYSYSYPNGTTAKATGATSGVSNMIDCGPGGYPVTAYRIEMVTYFYVDGFGLSCSMGLPAGASCSLAGGRVTATFAHPTCQYNKSSCKHKLGTLTFTAPPLGTIINIWMQTQVTLVRSDGYSFTWQTDSV